MSLGSLSLVFVIAISVSFAAAFGSPVSIIYSDSCLTQIKHNMTSSCGPGYGYLSKYDTTNPKVSGKFILKDGMIQRDKPMIKNHILFYKGNVTIIDPDIYTKERTDLIIIEGKTLAWKSNDDRRVIENTIISYHGRYMEGCSVAHIKWDEALLQDTIRYLQNGCTWTEFDNKVVKKNPYSKLSYDGLWYKHLKYLEDAKKLKGTNCLKSSLC